MHRALLLRSGGMCLNESPSGKEGKCEDSERTVESITAAPWLISLPIWKGFH